MITATIDPAAGFAVAGWTLALLLAIASLACMIITLRTPRRGLVYAAALLLAVSLIVIALPERQAPLGFTVLAGIIALALSIIGGGPATQLVFALTARGTSRPGSFGGIMVTEPHSEDQSREILRGGTVIGLLERLATTGAIMVGFPAALAIIVGLKGIGRFGELTTPEARERFIVGTFVSLIWASACAFLFLFTV